MKYSVFAIRLVLGGCATSGPPAVFELDYGATQAHVCGCIACSLGQCARAV